MTATHIAQIALEFGPEFQGFPILIQALTDEQVLIVINAVPSFRLRLSAESDLSRRVEQLGFSDEIKLQDATLDNKYVVRSATPELLAEGLTVEVKGAIAALDPLIELDLTAKEYRLIYELDHEPKASVQQSLERLVQLALLTRVA
jgi:hypothetical protein